MDDRTRYQALRARGEVEMAKFGQMGYAARTAKQSMPLWMRFDPALCIIIALFVAFEVVAHFHYHNANGWWTLSNRIVTFQQKYGWPARVVIYSGLVYLGLHLWGGIVP